MALSESDEMGLLYLSLGSNSVVEEKMMTHILENKTIMANLALRVKISQIVGLIKFLNELPVHVPEVEKQILDGIRKRSVENSINPALTASFFKTIIEHSRAVQTRLAASIKGGKDEAKNMLENEINSLKNAVPRQSATMEKMFDKNASYQEQLASCRGIIEQATNTIFSEMATLITHEQKPYRRLSKLCGMFFDPVTRSPQIAENRASVAQQRPVLRGS